MTDTTSHSYKTGFTGAVTVAATTPATLSPRDKVMDTIESASIRAELDSLIFNDEQLAGRVRALEKALDTRATPLYKRIIFRIDGWPSWAYVAVRPQWRPWRKWYRS